MRPLSLLAACVLLLALPGAHAFERPFPAGAKRGILVVGSHPELTLNGSQRRLSAGGWIRNQHNTIDLPVSLQGQEWTVNYTENTQGEIDRVWILTPQEARKPAPAGSQAAPFSSSDVLEAN